MAEQNIKFFLDFNGTQIPGFFGIADLKSVISIDTSHHLLKNIYIHVYRMFHDILDEYPDTKMLRL